jgi:hypothetical protein
VPGREGVNLSASGAPTLAFARSHNLIVLSADPEANISLVGSIAILRTQPKCDDNTVASFQGACQVGVGILILGLDLDFCEWGIEDDVSVTQCNIHSTLYDRCCMTHHKNATSFWFIRGSFIMGSDQSCASLETARRRSHRASNV